MKSELPRIGITMGDPAGIGPEIIVKALCEDRVLSICRPVVFGDRGILTREAEHLQLLPPTEIEEASCLDPGSIRCGQPSSEGGRAMALALSQSLDNVMVCSCPPNRS